MVEQDFFGTDLHWLVVGIEFTTPVGIALTTVVGKALTTVVGMVLTTVVGSALTTVVGLATVFLKTFELFIFLCVALLVL